MDTQNTPVHAGLWHRDFWLLALASLLLTAAMYLPLPLLPAWMMQVCGCTPLEAAVCVGVPGVGIFMFGCFCSYLVQRYRRNHVCIYSLFVVAVCFYFLQFIHRGVGTALGAFGLVAVVRLAQGALFGLAQMVLSSTLIIDTCESFRRTEANYSAAWFSRIALSLGPVLALGLLPAVGFGGVMIVGVILCMVAVMLIWAFLCGKIKGLCTDEIGGRFAKGAGDENILIMLIIGITIMCLAAALYFTANMGVSVYDAVALCLSERTPIKFQFCRMGSDVICVVIGFIFGAQVGLGTIITMFFTGPLINMFQQILAIPLIRGRNPITYNIRKLYLTVKKALKQRRLKRRIMKGNANS